MIKLTKKQVLRDIAALPKDYKTKDVDALIRAYLRARADVSELKEHILDVQELHRIYYYVSLKQIKEPMARFLFIHENMRLSDWWHTDQLISFVKEIDFETALRYAKEYIRSADAYVRRWGYVLFISDLGRRHAEAILPLMQDDDAYTVQMAEAWLIAELAVFEPQIVYEWMARNALKYNINSKAIQKICDSFRIPEDWKLQFKGLRPKLRLVK